MSVQAEYKETKQVRRLATFAEGVFFGDMAILEDKPCSTTVYSEIETHVLFIIANQMLLEISRELANRLRIMNMEIQTLAGIKKLI